MRLDHIAVAAASTANFRPPASSMARADDAIQTYNNLRAPRQRRLLQQVSYPPEQPYSASLLNPERGFYTQLTYRASSPARLDASSLAGLRADGGGESVILRLFYLDEFLGGPVSQDFLDDVEADFGTMRAAGVKCVLRFAYTSVQGGTSDPVKSVLLGHIAQLKDILAANQDAILAVQAGFVGPWGEWHSSTNFDDDLEGRREIVSALLEAVPERTVQIRTPLHKQTLYESMGDPALFSEGHVANGGFEGSDVASSWSGFMEGYVVDSTGSEGGSQSVKVVNGAAKQWVALTAEEGYAIEISGFSKRVGATGGTPWDYSIYADVEYSDNTHLWGQMAKFSGENEWNKGVTVIPVPPGKTVVGMAVYCMYRYAGQGYALFDDVAVSVYELPSLSGAEAIDDSNTANETLVI